MKRPTVKLFLRIRLANGKRVRVLPAYKNHRPRVERRIPFAVVGGKEVPHPEGVYQLRYRNAKGKRIWETIGKDPDEAIAARMRKERELEILRDAPAVGLTVKQEESNRGRIKLGDAMAQYLADMKATKAKKTYSGRKLTLDYFGQSCTKLYLDQVNRRDLLDFKAWLYQAKKLSDRSVYNRFEAVRAFLRSAGHPIAVLAGDRPDFVPPAADVYEQEQLASLFKSVSWEDSLWIKFLLFTGAREQELQFTCWNDVDLKSCTFTVRAHPELGFKPKDKEERIIPIPDSLVSLLTQWRAKNLGAKLIFTNRKGQPEGHFLRRLKGLAYTGGLNCGHCVNRVGKGCQSGPFCEAWTLHKFRRTYATTHLDAGVPVRTIQKWLGHSSLDTTLAYLAVADARKKSTRDKVNQSFAAYA